MTMAGIVEYFEPPEPFDWRLAVKLTAIGIAVVFIISIA